MLQNIDKKVISIHLDFSASIEASKVKHLFFPRLKSQSKMSDISRFYKLANNSF